MESRRNIASHSSIISKEQSKQTCTSQNGNIQAIKNVVLYNIVKLTFTNFMLRLHQQRTHTRFIKLMR